MTKITNHYGYIGNIEVPNYPEDEYLNIGDLDVQIEKEGEEYVMTELGSLFVLACSKKKIMAN